MPKNKKFDSILWLSVFPLLLLLSFYVSWLGLSKVNFLYAFWYEHTALEKFIDFYAPQNKFKKNFELVDDQGRIEIFSKIVSEINSGGSGLGEIVYTDNEGKIIDTFLRDAERIHLEYVSALVLVFKYLAAFSLFVLIFFLVLMYYYTVTVPVFKKLGLHYLYIFLLIGFCVLLYGPENTFVFLHESIYPENHQWHFYYQESLMTTLMMAPDLFAYIGGVWITSALLLFFISSFLLLRYFSQLKNR